MTRIEIPRDAAVELFGALGLNSAVKWNAKRMAAKLAKIDEMVDDDTDLNGTPAETLTTVLEGIQAGAEIVVTAGTPAPAKKAPAKKAAKKSPAKKAAKKKAEPKEPGEEPGEEPSKAKAEPKEPGIPGVRKARTRPYIAGTIVARHGLDAGVTPAMVAELDEEYGKVNPTESTFCLKAAWHAIRGYQEQLED